jgi:hypothetical protein
MGRSAPAGLLQHDRDAVQMDQWAVDRAHLHARNMRAAPLPSVADEVALEGVRVAVGDFPRPLVQRLLERLGVGHVLELVCAVDVVVVLACLFVVSSTNSLMFVGLFGDCWYCRRCRTQLVVLT